MFHALMPSDLRPRRSRPRASVALSAAAVLATTLVAGCSSDVSSTRATSGTSAEGSGAQASTGDASASDAAITVSGKQLQRGGEPWVPHGFVSIAFVAPPKAAEGVFARAYQRFSPADMRAAKAWGADSVRFQVSQPGLDPDNSLYDKDFRKKVIAGVRAARDAGLTALVSVQDEEQSGEQKMPTPLPDDATRRVWQQLTPSFNKDRGIVYELLNEPRPSPSPQNWARWGAAMNETIKTIRDSGSHNLVVADGLVEGERLSGAPALADPMHQYAYASHPYAHDKEGQTRQAWDDRFGDFARTHPVIVTEWTTIPKFYCDGQTPDAAAAFIDYLRTRRIGLMAFAYDFDGQTFGSVLYGREHRTSTYSGVGCGQPSFGPGTLVQKWYRGS